MQNTIHTETVLMYIPVPVICSACRTSSSIFNENVLLENRRLHTDGNLEYNAVESIFLVSGMVGVLEQWLADGMKIPRPKIATMLNQILCKINV